MELVFVSQRFNKRKCLGSSIIYFFRRAIRLDLGALGIPSICPEIGSSDLFSLDFTIRYRFVLNKVLQENIDWLEHTYNKIGN